MNVGIPNGKHAKRHPDFMSESRTMRTIPAHRKFVKDDRVIVEGKFAHVEAVAVNLPEIVFVLMDDADVWHVHSRWVPMSECTLVRA